MKGKRRRPTPAEQLLEPDGLPARDSSDYALEKLYYAARYMDIFANGMKNSFKHRVYLDLLAGPGRIQVDRRQYPGSPILSMAEPFTQRVFVESNETLAAALATRLPGSDIEIGDINQTSVTDRVVSRVSQLPAREMLGLAFVDNLGLTVTFDTLARLTRRRAIDLMIVVQLQDFTRNAVSAARDDERHSRFTAYFGSDGWLDVATQAIKQNASDAEIANRLVTFYQAQLQTIGYTYSKPGVHLMRNSKNAIQYRLLLAGKHEKAVEFFTKIEKSDPYGQTPLLGF